MIPRITRGSSAAAALAYDFGPGRREEHVDARTVAGTVPGDWRAQAALIDATVAAKPRVEKGIWRTSLRAAPQDRVLTDAEWGQIADRYITEMGVSAHPWTATRHGDDHIHLTVSRVSWQGNVVPLHRDFPKAQAACRAIEAEHHLIDASQRYDKTRPQVVHGEREYAARRGLVPEREQLRVRVDAAATRVKHLMGPREGALGITGEDIKVVRGQVRRIYEAQLAASGVTFRANAASTGRISGYSYGLVGHTDAAGEQVFFKGSQLGKGFAWAATREYLGAAVTQAMATVQAQRQAQRQAQERTEQAQRQAQAAWAALPLAERMARLRQAGLGQAPRRPEVGSPEAERQARQRSGQRPSERPEQRPGRRPGWGAGSAAGQQPDQQRSAPGAQNGTSNGQPAAQTAGQQPSQQPGQPASQPRRGLVSAAERERLRLEHEQIQARKTQRERALAAAEATHRQASAALASAQQEWTAAARSCEEPAAGVSRARFEVDQVAGVLTRTRREIERRPWATRVRLQLAEDLGTVTGGRAGVPRGQDQARVAVLEDHLRSARQRLAVAEERLGAAQAKVAAAGQVVDQARGAVLVAGQAVERARAVGWESTMSITRYEALLDREARAAEPEDVRRARMAAEKRAEKQAEEHAETMRALRRSHFPGYGPGRDQGHGYGR